MRFVLLAIAVSIGTAFGAEPPKGQTFCTDPAQADADFKFQGEYSGEVTQADGTKLKLGAQVRALSGGNFRTMFYGGGLPGDGWDGKTIIQKAPSTDAAVPTDSKLDGDKVVIDQVYKGTVDGKVLSGTTDAGMKFELKRVERTSPTMGAKPPAGAIVLFDGSNIDEWTGAKLWPGNLLGPGATTKRKFQDYTLHLEFMISYVPWTQGIGQRPNSGVYLQQHYEIQLLDSFGVIERDHDCGVLYAQVTPKINMCYPPLSWQSYDIDFTASRWEDGKKTKLAKCTVNFNGTVILDNVDIKGSTPGGTPESAEPAGFYLQAHGLPILFRNIWLVEKK
ncbi:MAG TPA: family 16 glycoside hydrolase [Planctomycetota bacterium]|jgi:hypothetical protein